MIPLPYRVQRVKRETHDTCTLDLVPAFGGRSMRFAPGQFNMIYMAGLGEAPISISSDPLTPEPISHTIRAMGTVTKALCRLKEGAVVGLRGPFGTAWPLREAAGNDVVIVAGGIGLAPLRPSIHHLFDNRDVFGKLTFLYGARTPREILFRRELEKWRGRFDVDVEITVDSPGEDWYGRVGVVTSQIARAPFDPINTIAFVCGPEVMMRYAVMELRNRGVDPEYIYVSLERSMKCGIGLCGHCQCGSEFVCKDGPVFPYSRIEHFFKIREL